MKKEYSRFRELWAVPKYKILIKLGLWFLFFSMIFILASCSGPPNYNGNNSNTVTYSKMKRDLQDGNFQIKYVINSDYIIEGTLIDDVINGTLEMIQNDTTQKLKIEAEKVYLIKRGEPELSSVLNEFNLIYLFPKHIISIINENTSVQKQSVDQKIFFYNVDGKSYSVYIDEKAIIKIVVFDGNATYELSYQSLK